MTVQGHYDWYVHLGCVVLHHTSFEDLLRSFKYPPRNTVRPFWATPFSVRDTPETTRITEFVRPLKIERGRSSS